MEDVPGSFFVASHKAFCLQRVTFVKEAMASSEYWVIGWSLSSTFACNGSIQQTSPLEPLKRHRDSHVLTPITLLQTREISLTDSYQEEISLTFSWNLMHNPSAILFQKAFVHSSRDEFGMLLEAVSNSCLGTDKKSLGSYLIAHDQVPQSNKPSPFSLSHILFGIARGEWAVSEEQLSLRKENQGSTYMTTSKSQSGMPRSWAIPK